MNGTAHTMQQVAATHFIPATRRMKSNQFDFMQHVAGLSLKQGMGNRGIGESGNRGIGESSLLCILDCLCQSLKRGILPAVHTRLPMPIFKTGNPPCCAY